MAPGTPPAQLLVEPSEVLLEDGDTSSRGRGLSVLRVHPASFCHQGSLWMITKPGKV